MMAMTLPQSVGLDRVSGALPVIDNRHSHLHEGNCFTFEDSFNQSGESTREYLITTPDSDILCHMYIGVLGEAGKTIKFVEGTGKTGGTPVTTINRNRTKSKTAEVMIAENPTGTEGSVVILSSTTMKDTVHSVGGSVTEDIEFVLNRDEKYSLTIENFNASAKAVTVSFNWYETKDMFTRTG